MIIAYEPIWAIGRDAVRDATPEEFYEVKIFIKKSIERKFWCLRSTDSLWRFSHSQNAESFMSSSRSRRRTSCGPCIS